LQKDIKTYKKVKISYITYKRKVHIDCYNFEFCKEKTILFAHGFPGTNRLPGIITHLRKKGFSWVEINYKGDKKTKGKFSFLGSIEDIKDATNWIQSQFNPYKLYILGYSYGGFCTLNLIRENPNLYDKVLLLNPVIDAEFFKIHPIMPSLWDIAEKILKLYPKDFYREEIEKIINNYNPIKFTHELKDNLYIIQSTEDMLCPKELAKEFAKITNSTFIPLLDKGHDLKGEELINILPL